jgi:hypothetical protein
MDWRFEIDAAAIPALIGIVGLLVAQAVAAWVTVKNGQKVDTLAASVKANAGLAQDTAVATTGRLEQIHVLTNSNLTSLKAQLAAAEQKIGRLEQLVTDLAAENRAVGGGRD